MNDEQYEQCRRALVPRLTDEFLETLSEAAALTMFDDYEVGGFVAEVYQLAGKELPKPA
jgi:hypothetical protein